MANAPSTDASTLTYEAYIDEKWKTGAVLGVCKLEPQQTDIDEDIELAPIEPPGLHRPTGFRVHLPGK